MLSLTLETPTMTIWAAFQLQHLPYTAMFWFKCEGHTTPCLATVVLDTVQVCPGMVASKLLNIRTMARVHRNCAQDHLFKQTGAQHACLPAHQMNCICTSVYS